jgi:hypothetical protein
MIALTSQGTLAVLAQNLKDANGSTDPASGETLFTSTNSGQTWSATPSPVAIPSPASGPCDNYSSALLPSTDGTSILEIATRDPGSGCTAYVGTGSLPTAGSVVSLRAHVNGDYVAAENAGSSPLIANRTAIGSWEEFDLIHD